MHGASLCKVSCSVTIPSEDPFCGQQPLHTHGATGVNARSTNTNFRSCTKNSVQLRSVTTYWGLKVNFETSILHFHIRWTFVVNQGVIYQCSLKNGLVDLTRQKDCDYRHNIIMILRHFISISNYFES